VVLAMIISFVKGDRPKGALNQTVQSPAREASTR